MKKQELLFKGEKINPIEMQKYRKDGSSGWVFSIVSLNDIGREIFFLVITQVITERKEAEEFIKRRLEVAKTISTIH